MEVKINREIREYSESIFFGLNVRQIVFSIIAVLAAVGIYFGLRVPLGSETVSWLCIVGASPFAALGFIKYNGMNAEQIAAALTRIGDPYSQPKRGQGKYVDCSYFVMWAWQQAGKSLPSTSVEQAKYCVENNLTIAQSELQPGDLVFWSKTTCGCGRWKQIHHVGMYIGDGKVIEASSSKGQVVVSKLWGLNGGKWQVYAFARP